MTDQEINHAIAESVGLKKIVIDGSERWMNANGIKCSLPDFCNDLNIMKAVFDNACDHLKQDIAIILIDIVCKQPVDDMSLISALNSSAKDRAKAYLMALYKWREN